MLVTFSSKSRIHIQNKHRQLQTIILEKSYRRESSLDSDDYGWQEEQTNFYSDPIFVLTNHSKN